MDGEVKILGEAEYVNEVIDQRQGEIDKIGNIMNDIGEIAKDFAVEVDVQGDKLADVGANMENVAGNTKEATKQLKEANRRSKGNGKCLIIIAAIIF